MNIFIVTLETSHINRGGFVEGKEQIGFSAYAAFKEKDAAEKFIQECIDKVEKLSKEEPQIHTEFQRFNHACRWLDILNFPSGTVFQRNSATFDIKELELK
jgi:hypothetical protein